LYVFLPFYVDDEAIVRRDFYGGFVVGQVEPVCTALTQMLNPFNH
jgi:hypothetical protein